MHGSNSVKDCDWKKLRYPLYPAELGDSECESRTICVTGASGFLGGEIVRRLLILGHRVHGTVRECPDDERFEPLNRLSIAFERRLVLYEAELSRAGSFDEAVRGCQAVIHVASPATTSKKDAGKNVVKPAVEGVENVIEAIEKSGTVDTLVYTSSMSAAMGDNWEMGANHVYNEEDWNKVSSLKQFPYAYSKTLAEKKCWELFETQEERRASAGMEGIRWRLVTLLPGFIVGPPAFLGRSELIDFSKSLLKGKVWPLMANFEFSYVDLEDVAAAHCIAAVDKAVSGRYMVAHGNRTQGLLDFLRSIHSNFKNYRFPLYAAPTWLLWVVSKCSKTCPWDLVEMTVKKPMKFDASKITKDCDLRYHDPKEGMTSLLNRIVDLGGV